MKGRFLIPSESIFRDVLIRVDPEQFDLALQQWHEAHGQEDEIGMVIPLLEAIAIHGKTITVDALLTQRKFAEYVVNREADYHFTVKNNQPTLRADIALFFEN